MKPFIKALRIFANPLLRIAIALEDLRRLYELDLKSRGVYFAPEIPIKDMVDICYGPQPVKDDEEW